MGLIPLRRYFLARALTEPNQRLEDDDLVPRLASGRALPLLIRLAPNRPQLSAEILPGHDRVQDNQWVLLDRDRDNARQGRRPQADPFLSLATKPAGCPPSQSRARKRSIFRGAHMNSH